MECFPSFDESERDLREHTRHQFTDATFVRLRQHPMQALAISRRKSRNKLSIAGAPLFVSGT